MVLEEKWNPAKLFLRQLAVNSRRRPESTSLLITWKHVECFIFTLMENPNGIRMYMSLFPMDILGISRKPRR
jgi:hypothetical protein